jgi:hypothetical protein
VSQEALRKRRINGNWSGGLEQSNMPSLDELLVMKNESEVGRILRSLERTNLKAELESTAVDTGAIDAVGKTARAVQSISRAIANTTAVKAKIPRKIRPPGTRMRNLANIEGAFKRIAEKARAAQYEKTVEDGEGV